MNYEEFERKILKIVYEDQIHQIRPSELAFAFDLSIEDANRYLDAAADNGVLDIDFSDGSPVYFVPGMNEPKDLPKVPAKTEVLGGADGSISSDPAANAMGVDGAIKRKSVVVSLTQTSINKPQPAPTQAPRQVQREMVLYEDNRQLSAEELTFSNASRTMFSRKIRIENTDIQREELVTRVTNLFRSFGYRHLENDGTTVRFERGSVAFLLALIPLFVLILPMFVYLLLSVLGRSTIQKEPILLDVKFEKKAPYWEIDLTFLGLHGVVLGPADQKVLNREIDTLQDELKYAFHR